MWNVILFNVIFIRRLEWTSAYPSPEQEFMTWAQYTYSIQVIESQLMSGGLDQVDGTADSLDPSVFSVNASVNGSVEGDNSEMETVLDTAKCLCCQKPVTRGSKVFAFSMKDNEYFFCSKSNLEFYAPYLSDE